MGSNDGRERTPGGSEILHHVERERELELAGPGEHAELIEQHAARWFGEPQSVFHEVISDLVHIDVHIVPPRPGRDVFTLFTTGMSDKPMSTPEGAEDARYAELVLVLPSSWRLDLLDVTPPRPDLEAWWWPVRWMKQLARLPHEYETWLGSGHTVPNGDPPAPFHDGTELCCWLLLDPVGLPAEARFVALPDGNRVHFLVMHALYRSEVGLKLSKGTGALLEAFDRAGKTEVLELRRPPAVRKKLFGLF